MNKQEILALKLRDIRIDEMLNNDSKDRQNNIHLSASQYIEVSGYQCWIKHQINGLDTNEAFAELKRRAEIAILSTK